MSTQMMSDLLVDLSADEQQLLAGGQVSESEKDDDDSDDDSRETGRRTKLYKIRSSAIVRVTKLR
ncbi:hypothetical protein [Fortiea contorta]|uniref:hypothetical protein n=1 Tax=Fortiea contorta TaxID=1892405 RepID=UPI00034CCA33|nr:hypothetical protein [Fortiea contorta]